MRCLIVADLHYSLPQYDWLVAQAPNYDLLIIAGDHIDLSSTVDGRAQMVVITKYLDLLKDRTRVFTCSGNHDLDGRDEEGEKTSRWIADLNARGIASDDSTVELDGVLFTMCRWWDGPKAQLRLGEQLARDAERPKRQWFWVHHAPAADSPICWSGNKFVGDIVLLKWIEQYQPDMVFSGHIHQSPFTRAGSWADRVGKSWVFNVGQHPGAPPAHMILDTVENEIVWFSMVGVQSAKLDAPIAHPLPPMKALPDWLRPGGLVGGRSLGRSSDPAG